MLRHVDADLRLRRVDKVAELTHSVLHDCWGTFIKSLPAMPEPYDHWSDIWSPAASLQMAGRYQPPSQVRRGF
jgi:hypothetical protein